MAGGLYSGDMAEYVAPLRDIRFVLEQIVDLAAVSRLGRLPPRRSRDRLRGDRGGGPVCVVGDRTSQPGRRHDRSAARRRAQVITPPGFQEAYRRYVDAGWGAVPFDPEYGGGGFPWLVTVVLQEMLTSANMALSLCPLLTQGAIDMLSHHGSAEQRASTSRR